MKEEQKKLAINKQKLRKKALRRAIHRKNVLERYIKKQTVLIERKQKAIDSLTPLIETPDKNK